MPESEPARRTSKQLLAAQNLVLEMIASGAPLDEVLRAVANLIDRQAPSGICAIFLLDADGGLRLKAGPKLPEGFAAAVDRVAIGPCHGACGTAAYRRERVIVSDVAKDPLFEVYRDVALAHGLRSVWSTSIHPREGAILGTMAIYHSRRHAPKKREIAAVEEAVHLISIAVERARLDAELRSSRELFRSLIEHTSDIVSIVDEKGVFKYVSPSMERVLGFSPGEMIGTSAFDGVDSADLAASRQRFEETLQQPGAWKLAETTFLHRDGSRRVIETIANNQLSNPAIAGVIMTGRDITERKRTEEELISSQESYHELLENANDAVYTHDLTGRLTSMNKAAERITGYAREEVLGASIDNLMSPESRALAREMLERKVGGEARTVYELEIVNRRGARVPVEVSSRLIFHHGRPVGVQGIARDISERRRFDLHTLQSQKMEAIGRLAGGVAHDFNNLLTVIAGYSQWMLEDMPAESPFVQSTSEILFAANRASALTNQLLAFSRNQVIQPVIVDLNSILAQLDPMLKRIIGEDIDLVTLTSASLGLVRADPGQVEQVILNLSINARDAMPNGGRLWIKTANAEIDDEFARSCPDCSPGSYVMIAVGDSGSGIEEHIKAHMFEPFFTTKEMGKGTGLGLSTVYGIVSQGGGCIRVESERGAGSTFSIYFPRVPDGVLEGGVPERQPRRGGAETVLLVEDEAPVRRIARGMLQFLGYRVLEAANAEDARKIFFEYGQPIHLLLSDVVMPGTGGPALARELKAAGAGFKVLYMSGYAGEGLFQEVEPEGNSCFLQKPFTLEGLAAKVREVLDA